MSKSLGVSSITAPNDLGHVPDAVGPAKGISPVIENVSINL